MIRDERDRRWDCKYLDGGAGCEKWKEVGWSSKYNQFWDRYNCKDCELYEPCETWGNLKRIGECSFCGECCKSKTFKEIRFFWQKFSENDIKSLEWHGCKVKLEPKKKFWGLIKVYYINAPLTCEHLTKDNKCGIYPNWLPNCAFYASYEGEPFSPKNCSLKWVKMYD